MSDHSSAPASTGSALDLGAELSLCADLPLPSNTQPWRSHEHQFAAARVDPTARRRKRGLATARVRFVHRYSVCAAPRVWQREGCWKAGHHTSDNIQSHTTLFHLKAQFRLHSGHQRPIVQTIQVARRQQLHIV
jgi:hypothetical protein